MTPADRENARKLVEARRRQQRARRAGALFARQEQSARAAEALANSNRRDASMPLALEALHTVHPRVAERFAEEAIAMQNALEAALALPALRELSAWKPQGKSARTLFRSLVAHRLARYPVPLTLWNGFFAEASVRQALAPMIAHVAAGGSLAEWIKQTGFPVPLTRKMCHAVLQTRDDVPLLHALRAAQVRGLGGSTGLLQGLLSDSAADALGHHVGDTAFEAWWNGAVQWMAHQADLDPRQVAPLCDYLRYLRRETPDVSLKGRTATSLRRAMEQWHRETSVGAAYTGARFFKPSGIAGATFDFTRPDAAGGTRHEVWSIEEVLTAERLLDEGQRQGHCVFSYARSVEVGLCSIWLMTLKNNDGRWAMLTIEVRNATRAIVQVRGRFNRVSTIHERDVLQRWATQSRLTLTSA